MKININDNTDIVKSPEGCFKQNVIEGYGLSKVEADVLWDYVINFIKEHYQDSRFDNQIIFYAVSADEPAGKPVKDCKLIPVRLTLYSYSDKKIKQRFGISSLRQHLAVRLSKEAHVQGALLSQSDLADILIVDRPTIKRMVRKLKKNGATIATRGEIRDIGPGSSHKARIIELLLKRYQPTEVSIKTGHSLSSITRYFENFNKVSYLYDDGYSIIQIRHLTAISEKVVREYIQIYSKYKGLDDYKDRLEEIKGYISSKKGALL
jgi:biotin operon repressor